MKTIYLEIEAIKKKTTKKITSKHLWFDIASQKMQTVECGKLLFKYDFVSKKMVIQPEDLDITYYENSSNEKNIIDWIESRDDLKIDDKESSKNIIAILLLKNNEEAIISEIRDRGFRYFLD
jgi:hypothetical protein